MASHALFSAPDLAQMAALGIAAEEAARQVELFRHPPPFTHVLRPCRLGDGIRRIEPAAEAELGDLFARAVAGGRVSKLVPASGAASRMFKGLLAELERREAEAASGAGPAPAPASEESEEIEAFFSNLPRFAFFAPLAASLRHDPSAREAAAELGEGGRGEPEDDATRGRSGRRDGAGLSRGARLCVLRHLLTSAGLDYAERPKGLIPFHRDSTGPRTPFEEHLVEAVDYARDGAGLCRLHFTVSTQHEGGFRALLDRLRPALERRHAARFEVSFSTQRRSTDTLAVDAENRPFRLADGSLLFRPGGHGALIGNLQELAEAGADLVLLKNIDNVVPDRTKPEVTRWKRLLTGLLLSIAAQAARHLEQLDGLEGREASREPEGLVSRELEGQARPVAPDAATEAVLASAEAFLESELGRKLPPGLTPASGGRAGTRTDAAAAIENRRRALIAALHRPLRVCGVVRNTGEPGGGPFWVQSPAGELSLQIVETSQIDPRSPAQQAALAASTHFSPVDISCALRDHRGRPFDLARFVDPATVFIAAKSHEGRSLKALERPGLWNGAMAGWNTVFVEVPDATFAPVKTVLDLLRPEHQP